MRRILVIEDDADVRDVLRELLENEGFDVAVATDGNDGLRLCGSVGFDAVVADLSASAGRDATTVAALKRASPRAKVIATCGRSGLAPDDLARRLGADRALCKPFRIGDVLRVLRDEGVGG